MDRSPDRVELYPSRRTFLSIGATLGLGSVLAGCSSGSSNKPDSSASAAPGWFMPDESAKQDRTWMAFGVQDTIWEPDQVPVVRRNLAAIADAIAQFEPVSLLVRSNEVDLAGSLAGDQVDIVVGQLDDLWMRDTGPVFVTNEAGDLSGVGFNFNGWEIINKCPRCHRRRPGGGQGRHRVAAHQARVGGWRARGRWRR